MTTPLYDDDMARDAELIAQRWADQYTGRHRISDELMEDLVQAELYRLAGEDTTAEALERIAASRIGGPGRFKAARDTARSIAEERLVDQAHTEMTLMLGHSTVEPCYTPARCDELERTAAQEMRPPSTMPPGRCSWCGGARW